MLKELIRSGEGEKLDFKQTIKSPRKIAKTLVAFANSTGGKILVGVKDNGVICGTCPEEEKHMLNAAADLYCRPCIALEFSEEISNGRTVLIAEVKESASKPHVSQAEDGKWWAYIRVKDKTLLASKIMLEVMRSNSRGTGARLQYGQPEKLLLQYLQENEHITAKEFYRLSKLSRWKANKILINMVRMGVVKVLFNEKAEVFTV